MVGTSDDDDDDEAMHVLDFGQEYRCSGQDRVSR